MNLYKKRFCQLNTIRCFVYFVNASDHPTQKLFWWQISHFRWERYLVCNLFNFFSLASLVLCLLYSCSFDVVLTVVRVQIFSSRSAFKPVSTIIRALWKRLVNALPPWLLFFVEKSKFLCREIILWLLSFLVNFGLSNICFLVVHGWYMFCVIQHLGVLPAE